MVKIGKWGVYMRIAVCDDEKYFRDSIKEKITSIYKEDMDTVVKTFDSGFEFLKHYNENTQSYDVIILDIEMGIINGIDTAKEIRKLNKDVNIIFLTSHDEFAKEGYEVNAFRFLSKPIQEDKLIESIESVKSKADSVKKVLVSNKYEDILIKIGDILYIEAQNKDIYLHTYKDIYNDKNNLGYYEELLKKDGFFRTHRSYLVNLDFVKSYTPKEITLDNGDVVYMSRLKYKAFKEHLYNHIKKTAR